MIFCGQVAKYGINPVSVATIQTESITCTLAPTADGNITITVTSANMANSPKAFLIPLLDADTSDEVATKVGAALSADKDINDTFLVDVTASTIKLLAKTTAVIDATLAFAYVDTDTTGATFGVSTDGTESGQLLGSIINTCEGHMVNVVTDETNIWAVSKLDHTRDRLVMFGRNAYIGEY